MFEVVCPSCLRSLLPQEFGFWDWGGEDGKIVQCRHCDVKLVVDNRDVKLVPNPETTPEQ